MTTIEPRIFLNPETLLKGIRGTGLMPYILPDNRRVSIASAPFVLDNSGLHPATHREQQAPTLLITVALNQELQPGVLFYQPTGTIVQPALRLFQEAATELNAAHAYPLPNAIQVVSGAPKK